MQTVAGYFAAGSNAVARATAELGPTTTVVVPSVQQHSRCAAQREAVPRLERREMTVTMNRHHFFLLSLP